MNRKLNVTYLSNAILLSRTENDANEGDIFYRRRERHTVGLKVLGRPRSEGRKRGVLPRNKSHARSEMGRVGRAIQGESEYD